MKMRVADMDEGMVFEYKGERYLRIEQYTDDEPPVLSLKLCRLEYWDLEDIDEYKVIGHIGPDGQLTEAGE